MDRNEGSKMRSRFLIYGSYGYTGELIAGLAAERGHEPILSGRNRQRLEAQASRLGLEHRVAALCDPGALEKALDGIFAVIHCAGPFAHTSKAMADACLKSGTHYLDITGEISVFEALAARDEEARKAGILFLPGVGFDVVPSDCLAAHLAGRLPTATRLVLGFQGVGGRLSHGTATTMAENLHRGGLVRKDGKLTPVPAGWKKRRIDFGRGPVEAMTIPWGDVSTAYHSTGIGDIEVYMAAPRLLRTVALASRFLGPLLGTSPVQAFLKAAIRRQPAGPSLEERKKGVSLLWGEAQDESGARVQARLEGPEGYTFTARSALIITEKLLETETPPTGFQTPSKAFGPDLVLEIEGVNRFDL